jgi:tetraacyldisaccharide 4'-kinase
MFSSFLANLFNLSIRVRNFFYQHSVLKSNNLDVPVISVGNITVGGTGKTPLVARIATILAENGRKPGILTRGYKRENPHQRVVVSDFEKILVNERSAGDEPFELALKLRGISAVIADKKRFAAGIWAKKNLNVNVFVLDDGFQHLQLQRDLDIVTIDASNPFGNGKLLPGGILREPLEGLKRADAIVLTRANLTGNIENLKTEIRKYNSHCPIFCSQTKIIGLNDLDDFFQIKDQKTKAKDQAVAFCGLGNPNGFYEQLKKEGFNLAGFKNFPDHHQYQQPDVIKIEQLAKEKGAQILLTTAKDAVKLRSLKFTIPCLVVEIEIKIDDEIAFQELILKTVN